MAAALCVHYSGEGSLASGRGDPVWASVLGFATVAFASASLGLHGIVAKRVNSQFGTAVVLTTVWSVSQRSRGRLTKTSIRVVVPYCFLQLLTPSLHRAFADVTG